MRRLVLKMSMSLDGFVAGPNGETDWMSRSRDEGAKASVAETLRQAGLHAMGRRTYAAMARHWPTSIDVLAKPMNEIPKVVFTRQPSLDLWAGGSLSAASWAEAQVANGDLATEIGRLKRQPGRDILAHGGVELAQSLARLGLIDEFRLLVYPVALGERRPLFANLPMPLDLELISTSSFASGVAAHVYRPAEGRVDESNRHAAAAGLRRGPAAP